MSAPASPDNSSFASERPPPRNRVFMQLRLIATDIDGTLLGSHEVVSKRTIQALRAADEAGVEVVAATGRSHWSAAPLLEPIGCVRWLLASNGATVFDLQAMEVVERYPIDRSVVGSVVATLETEFGSLGYSWETTDGVFQNEMFRAIRSQLFPSRKIARRSTAVFEPGADELVKLMVLHPTLADLPWLDAAAPHMPDVVNCATSGLGFIEFTAFEADKGLALAALCERLGVAQDQTVSFGDQSNDLGMLRWAGRGYAMANASAPAVDAASHRAPHHLDDGVAQVVEQLLADQQTG